MMGPGVDPHLYQPSARDLQSLRTADLIVFHGLQLEGKLASAFESTAFKFRKDHSISSQIDEALFLPAEEKKGSISILIFGSIRNLDRLHEWLGRQTCFYHPGKEGLHRTKGKGTC